MSKRLLTGIHLQVSPELAKEIGLNGAIILQQLHYWLLTDKVGEEKYGFNWIYNSYSGWTTNFPFWSESTIQRIMIELEKSGLVISKQLDKKNWNRKKYYRINYEAFGLLEDSLASPRTPQVAVIEGVKMRPSLKDKDYTKNTIHKEAISSQSSEISEASELNPKQGIPIKKPLPPNLIPNREAVASSAPIPVLCGHIHPIEGWNRMIFSTWKQKMGGIPIKSNMKAIKDLVGERGLPTVEKAWRWYLANTEGTYISIPSFCSKFGVYLQKAGGKELTPAEKAERDAKLYQKPRDQSID